MNHSDQIKIGDFYKVLRKKLQNDSVLIDDRALLTVFLLFLRYKRIMLSTQHLVETLNVSCSTLNRWRTDARGPAYKKMPCKGKNCRVRYHIVDVAVFLSSDFVQTD